MRAVSAELRTFANELSSLKAEMNNHLRKNTNTRLLLFGALWNLAHSQMSLTRMYKMQASVRLSIGVTYLG